jgi:hypothetical protein
MTIKDWIQLMVFLACLASIVIWAMLGLKNRRYLYLRWIVIIPSVLTALYYYLLIFTEFSRQNSELNSYISAMLRLYYQLLFLVGGIFLWIHRRKS